MTIKNNVKFKIITALSAFITAFVCGLTVWKQQPISLCTVTEYRSHYQLIKGDNYVNLKGYLYGGEDLGFSDLELNGCRGGNTAEVVLAEKDKLGAENQNLINELNRQTSISTARGSFDENKYARVQVEIIGQVSEREQYCFTSRYILRAEQIKFVGPIEVLDGAALAEELH